MNFSSPLLLFGGYAVLLIVAIYFFVWIPNKKKNKQMREMHASIAPGDTVVTIGGVVGKVKEKDDTYVTLVIDEEKGVNIRFLLMAVSQLREKASESPKSDEGTAEAAKAPEADEKN